MIAFGAAAASALRASAEFDETTVTPGVYGFIAIALIAVATILLGLDMVRRVRRTRYRGEIREQLAEEAEEAARRDPDPRDGVDRPEAPRQD